MHLRLGIGVLFKRLTHPFSKKLPIRIWTIITLIIITIIIFTLNTILTSLNHDPNSPLRSLKLYNSKMDSPFKMGCYDPVQYIADESYIKQNATLVMLTRNSELDNVLKSMKSLERHFNQWFQYPWVFLNDEEFNDEFKSTVKQYTNAIVEFGTIPQSQWEFPDEVRSTNEFGESIQNQGDRGIFYGSMESYHKMCRFFSGFFHKHPLVQKYEWYWRVEPDVSFYCDLTYDPFWEMKKTGKKYGFTIIIKEIVETVPNLFRVTKAYLKKFDVVPKSAWKLFVSNYKDQWRYSNEKRFNLNYKNIMDLGGLKSRVAEVVRVEKFVRKLRKPLREDTALNDNLILETIHRAKDRGRLPTLQGERMSDEMYDLHHFWSNFEIARVALWNNEVYESFFQYLDQHKGFYKERWGDAPVHSLAIAMMLDLEEIHYFRDIGYKHTTIHHCPANHQDQKEYKESSDNLSFKDIKFEKFWAKYDKPKAEYGIGCRCRCPKGQDVEDVSDDYLRRWFEVTADDYEPPGVTNIDRLEKEARIRKYT